MLSAARRSVPSTMMSTAALRPTAIRSARRGGALAAVSSDACSAATADGCSALREKKTMALASSTESSAPSTVARILAKDAQGHEETAAARKEQGRKCGPPSPASACRQRELLRWQMTGLAARKVGRLARRRAGCGGADRRCQRIVSNQENLLTGLDKRAAARSQQHIRSAPATATTPPALQHHSHESNVAPCPACPLQHHGPRRCRQRRLSCRHPCRRWPHPRRPQVCRAPQQPRLACWGCDQDGQDHRHACKPSQQPPRAQRIAAPSGSRPALGCTPLQPALARVSLLGALRSALTGSSRKFRSATSLACSEMAAAACSAAWRQPRRRCPCGCCQPVCVINPSTTSYTIRYDIRYD
eukprot:m.32502 g.32502  ORF g.32502 m.32502 type:complete len:358 (-) comp5544_c0_seq1:26-1099(-)